MGSSEEHSRLVDDVLMAVGGLSFARCWKNATGAARSFDDPDRIISFGIKGSPDLIGILQGGFFFGIEVKTGQAVQNKDQKNFEAMCKKFNAHYFLVRTVQQALDCVTKAAQLCKAGSE